MLLNKLYKLCFKCLWAHQLVNRLLGKMALTTSFNSRYCILAFKVTNFSWRETRPRERKSWRVLWTIEKRKLSSFQGFPIYKKHQTIRFKEYNKIWKLSGCKFNSRSELFPKVKKLLVRSAANKLRAKRSCNLAVSEQSAFVKRLSSWSCIKSKLFSKVLEPEVESHKNGDGGGHCY